MSWQVQRVKASGLSGFMVPALHGAASSQAGSKCVGRGSSHHSAAQTPSTTGSKVQNIKKGQTFDFQAKEKEDFMCFRSSKSGFFAV